MLDASTVIPLLPLLVWVVIAAITPPLFVADVRLLRLPNRLLLIGAAAVLAVTAAGGVWAALGQGSGRAVVAVVRVAGDGLITLSSGLPSARETPFEAVLAWNRAAPFAAAGAAIVVFAGIRMLGAIGMGDVKLVALLAAALGFLPAGRVASALGLGLFVACCTAGAAAALHLVLPYRADHSHGCDRTRHDVVNWRRSTAAMARTELMPFGPFLLAGFWFALVAAL